MYEDLIRRLREDAENQERVLHVCDSTINALEAAEALEEMDAQLDVLIKEDIEAQQELAGYRALGTLEHLQGIVEAEQED